MIYINCRILVNAEEKKKIRGRDFISNISFKNGGQGKEMSEANIL